MRIIADAHIPFLKGIAEQYGETTYLKGKEFTRESIRDADTLIVRTVTHFGAEMLEGSNVKLICSATIGFDHIDTEYCQAKGIRWANAPGCNSGSVQQYITSALIEISRQKGFPLEGKTIGIIGVGNVGKKVAKIARLLRMKVLLNDPPRQRAEGGNEFTDLETIKREADIITFHTPLTKNGEDKTFHLADESFFSSLGKKPIIFNTARGPIVETEAIKKAIRQEKISAAVIDCWENEPNIDLEYLRMVDIATPHIAGYSADGKGNATSMSLETLVEFYGLDKTPISQINIPAPECPVIDLNAFPAHSRLHHALLHTYTTQADNNDLKANPQNFAFFREHYPLRRENGAYTVINYLPEEKEILQDWGFRL
ncbi:MAG: erythronate-4-phosphate dehydrogenase [Bacteroidales bacterium 45-6]|nr:MAG: erythronate-4-phosphate dehydrogenase [Bacteroidales bacterium 45-6]